MAEKSSTPLVTRIVMITGAALFLLTSSALAFFVIFDSTSNSDSNEELTSTSIPNEAADSADPNSAEGGKKLEDFKPVSRVSSLIKTDIKEGDGETIKSGDSITVMYTGAIASSGTIFESSSQPTTFTLGDGLIKGWTEGIPGMKVGGTRQLLIPFDKAYGEAGSPPKIPARADLVFNITVISKGTEGSN